MQPRHSAASTTARTTLRDYTRDAHLRLHELEIFRAFVAGTLARAGYHRLLACLHDYYQHADDVLDRACKEHRAHEFNYRYQPRAPLFARDLQTLGGAIPYRHGHTSVLPAIDSAAALAGALYVIEGSLLGGATLDTAARRLLASRDAGDTDGRSYWSWCREVSAGRWQETTTLIDGWVDSPTRLQHALNAARATFEQLHGWLLPLAETPC